MVLKNRNIFFCVCIGSIALVLLTRVMLLGWLHWDAGFTYLKKKKQGIYTEAGDPPLSSLAADSIGHFISEAELLTKMSSDHLDGGPRRATVCSMDTCFDYARCTKSFKVYVYPDTDNPSYPSASPTYTKILASLRLSRHLTHNSSEACLFIPSLDTLDRDPLSPNFGRHIAAALPRLPHWNGGRNHLLFNLYAGTWPDYREDQYRMDVGQAILAKASFSTANFRRNFDVSMPLIHPEHREMPQTLPNPLTNGYLTQTHKPLLLAFKGKRYLSGIGSASRTALYHLHNGKDVVLVTTCRHGTDWQRYADERCQVDNAQYDRFLEVLKAGCIPVLLSNDAELPFSDVIDWRETVVWADERLLFQLIDLVYSIPHDRIVQLRQQAKFLWDTYFSSVHNIVHTVLEIIRDRVVARPRNRLEWNTAPGGLILQPGFPFHHSCHFPSPVRTSHSRCPESLVSQQAGVTVVVVARAIHSPCSLPKLIVLMGNLARSAHVRKVVVLWQCPGTVADRSRALLERSLGLRINLTLIGNITNSSPNLRFLPLDNPDLIPTEAVFNIDSDVSITASHVDFAYSVWRQFPDRLVGYLGADHEWDAGESRWRYVSPDADRATYSMVLIGAGAMYHRSYHWLYWHLLGSRELEVVDVFGTCEDLLFNCLVSHTTHQAPLKLLDPATTNRSLLKSRWMSSSDLTSGRNVCLQAFARQLGYLPLVRSGVRWDPLLYKDPVATWRKRYAELENDLGAAGG